ncbi:extensin [Streptomyces sp. NPDC002680]|uniref:extensin n=1 Tax=Streptomyces sp. NPDC002680 TaxID=3364659 RepID=UPI00368EF576
MPSPVATGAPQTLPVAPKAVPLRRPAPTTASTPGHPTATPVGHAPVPLPPPPVAHGTAGSSTPVQRTHATPPTPPRPPITSSAPAPTPVPAAVRIQRMAAPRNTPKTAPPPPPPPPPTARTQSRSQTQPQAQPNPPPPFDAKDLDDHQLDELTHRLIDRVTRKVRTELRLDRERIGKLRDPRH